MPMMMKTPEGMDPGLMEAAEETDAVIGEELAGKVRPFDKPVAPKVMGMELQPEKYTEAVTELDPDLVRFVSMLEAAAGDYGAPFPVAVVDLKDSAGLTALTAHLMALAKDKGFSEFLDMPAPEMEGEGMEMEMDTEEGGGEEFDFAARMGPPNR